MRGRANSQTATKGFKPAASKSVVFHQRRSSGSSNSGGSAWTDPAGLARPSFTRSRSPAFTQQVNGNVLGPTYRTSSPLHFTRPKHGINRQHIFPAVFQLSLRLPYSWKIRKLYIDSSKACEVVLLLASLGYATTILSTFDTEQWTSIELSIIILLSLLYTIWSHNSITTLISHPLPQSQQPLRSSSPRLLDQRRPIPLSQPKQEFGFVWMTVPKNYRDSSDDGILSAVLLGPIIAAAELYSSLKSSSSGKLLPETWCIESLTILPQSPNSLTAAQALVLSRRNLLDLATLCSTLLLVHVCASWWKEASQRRVGVPDTERASVPRSEMRRTWLYILFTFLVSMLMFGFRMVVGEAGWGIWQNLSCFEVAVSSLFYQFSLYIAIRLAHRGFTLGELGIVAFGGTVLFMEMLNLTIARMWPITTPFIKTYRLPTPLLLFQIALIPGSFLTGFLLSPLLVLSRHISRKPVRRLRFPQEKQVHRRALAAGFYAGAALIVGGLIGTWARWCLGNRDPWLYVIFWIMEGRKKWSRPLLLVYWVLMAIISVAAWNRQLARSRKYRSRNLAHGEPFLIVPGAPEAGRTSSDPSAPSTPTTTTSMSLSFPNLPNGTQMSLAATEFFDAADKHVPTLSLNARRKSFHALAVVMFLPGIAFDPAFAHLSFSAAFALFTFAEYVRYFALYPFGASLHLFMNEFLDHKDSGTAILSHFYLLTGCANSVWFEGPSQLLQYTGILSLGVGDALASIVGKRFGHYRWSPVNPKTAEGSVAFTLSVVAFAFVLRLCGLAEGFSVARYTLVVGLSSLLEAFSVQNDNLIVPMYMWSMLVFADF